MGPDNSFGSMLAPSRLDARNWPRSNRHALIVQVDGFARCVDERRQPKTVEFLRNAFALLTSFPSRRP